MSRMTARNAVQRLTQEGLVYRVPGRGTFVAEPPVHRQAGSLLSFTEEMRRRGRVPSSRVLAREVREPRPAEASRLQLDPAAEVIALRRLRLADDEPVAIEEAVFPADHRDAAPARRPRAPLAPRHAGGGRPRPDHGPRPPRRRGRRPGRRRAARRRPRLAAAGREARHPRPGRQPARALRVPLRRRALRARRPVRRRAARADGTAAPKRVGLGLERRATRRPPGTLRARARCG